MAEEAPTFQEVAQLSVLGQLNEALPFRVGSLVIPAGQLVWKA